MKTSLTSSFEQSLKKDLNFSGIADIADIGLDQILSNEQLRGIPFISAAMSIYQIGQSIRDKHHIKKLGIFLEEIERYTVDRNVLQNYIKKFKENQKYRDKELEFIIIMLDRYVHYDKSRILAKLYLSFLDGYIDMEYFSAYAVTIENLLPEDIKIVCNSSRRVIQDYKIDHNTSRLISAGFMTETRSDSPFISDNDGGLMITSSSMGKTLKKEKEYSTTKFGKVFVEIMQGY